nr:MAG TPA: hypothetical protein [Bacteriophage sp.]
MTLLIPSFSSFTGNAVTTSPEYVESYSTITLVLNFELYEAEVDDLKK